MLTRRSFLQTAAVAAAAPAAVHGAAPAAGPKRLAILASAYAPLSPAQQMGDRFLIGYPYAGTWHKPDAKVVSLYVEQKPEGDLSAARAREFDFKIYPSIAEAVRCGSRQVSVDAVLILAGHPNDEFFEQCITVFEKDDRWVPVYRDQSLSHSFETASTMVEAAKRGPFALMAGSPLPVTWRLPEIELPSGCQIEEALMVSPGGPGGEFHALEGLQCMVERRRGGETGVKSVQALEDAAVWQALDAGRFSKQLLTAALSRSDTPLGLTVTDGRTQDLVASGQVRVLAKHPVAYLIEYRDGLKASVLILEGALRDYNFATRLSGPEQVQSTQFLVTPRAQPDLFRLSDL